jgi:hypothetical protein
MMLRAWERMIFPATVSVNRSPPADKQLSLEFFLHPVALLAQAGRRNSQTPRPSEQAAFVRQDKEVSKARSSMVRLIF